MTIKGAIVATIDAEPKRVVRGKTLLFKKLYFVSVLTREDYGFSPYFYGPYSDVVSDQLGALIEAGFVKEETDSLGGYDQFGEIRKYSYSLTPAAMDMLERPNGDLARYRNALERINAHRVSQNLQLLAVASKVHLIRSEDGAVSPEEVKERASQYGWTVSAGDVGLVRQFLASIPAGDAQNVSTG